MVFAEDLTESYYKGYLSRWDLSDLDHSWNIDASHEVCFHYHISGHSRGTHNEHVHHNI